MSEKDITEDDVRREHMASANAPRHWLYLVAVLGGAFLLMVAFIAILGTGA